MKIIHSLLLIISSGIFTNTSCNSNINQYDYEPTNTGITKYDIEDCIRNSNCGSKFIHFNRRDEDESIDNHRFVSIEINPDKFMPNFHNKHRKYDENSKNKSVPSTTVTLHKSNVKRGPPPQNFDKNIGYNNFNYFNTYKIKPTPTNNSPTNNNSNIEGSIPTTNINLNSAKAKGGPPPQNIDKNIGYNNFNYFNTYKIKPTNVNSSPINNSNIKVITPTTFIDLNSAKAKRGPPPQNFDKNIGYNNFNYFNTYKIKPTPTNSSPTNNNSNIEGRITTTDINLNSAKAKGGPPPQNIDKNIGYNNFNYFNTYKIKPTNVNSSPINNSNIKVITPTTFIDLNSAKAKRGPPPQNFDKNIGYNNFNYFNTYKIKPTPTNNSPTNNNSNIEGSIPTTSINLNSAKAKGGPPPQNIDKNIGYNNFNYFNTYKIKPTNVNSSPSNNSNIKVITPTTFIDLNSVKAKRGPPPQNFDKNIGYNNFNYFNTYKIKPTPTNNSPTNNNSNIEGSIPTTSINLNSAKAKGGPPPQNIDKNIGYNNFNYFNTYKIKPTPTNNSPTNNNYYYNALPVEA